MVGLKIDHQELEELWRGIAMAGTTLDFEQVRVANLGSKWKIPGGGTADTRAYTSDRRSSCAVLASLLSIPVGWSRLNCLPRYHLGNRRSYNAPFAMQDRH